MAGMNAADWRSRGADEHRVYSHALLGEQRTLRLREVRRSRLGEGVTRDHRHGRDARQGKVVDDGPLGALQQRQQRARYVQGPEEIHGQLPFDLRGITEVVVEGQPGIVDEDVEAFDLSLSRWTSAARVTSNDTGVTRASSCRKTPRVVA